MVLALSIGLVLAAVLVVVGIHREVRAAYHGLTLSNGMDVLVSPAAYEEVLARFEAIRASAAHAGLDDERRWDEAVLSVLRVERPREWRFLVQSLNAAEPRARVPHGRPLQRVAP